MDIFEIRQRAEKATPGPWTLRPAEWECDCGGDEDGHAHKTPDQCRDGWWLDAAWVDGPKLIEHGDGWTGFNDADADFMAHAREDIPALCDALAQCQAWRQEDADNLNHCIRAKQKLMDDRSKLRRALAQLVGVDTIEELQSLEAIMRVAPAPAKDKAAAIDAIHTLIEVNP